MKTNNIVILILKIISYFQNCFFPKRLTSRGFRNQKEGGAGFWPISPGSVSEAGAGAATVIPIEFWLFFKGVS